MFIRSTAGFSHLTPHPQDCLTHSRTVALPFEARGVCEMFAAPRPASVFPSQWGLMALASPFALHPEMKLGLDSRDLEKMYYLKPDARNQVWDSSP